MVRIPPAIALLGALLGGASCLFGPLSGPMPMVDGGDGDADAPTDGGDAAQDGGTSTGDDGGAVLTDGGDGDGDGDVDVPPTLGEIDSGLVCGRERVQVGLVLPVGAVYRVSLTSPQGDDPDLHLYRPSYPSHVVAFGRVAGADEITVEGDGLPYWVAEVSSWDGSCHSYALTVSEDGGAGAFTTLSGSVAYEDRVYDSGGFTGAIVPAPARGVVIELINDDNDVLVATTTDKDGQWTLHAPLSATESYQLRAVSSWEAWGQWGRSRDRSQSEATYAMVSDPFTTGDLPTWAPVAPALEEGGAFNIADVVYEANAALAEYTSQLSPRLTVSWQRGEAFGCGSCYAGNRISLGGQLEDPDEYDDDIILHEFGHYWASHYAPDNSPGGSHRDMRVSPQLAWGEGLAYWFAGAVRDEPVIVDTYIDGLRVTDQEAITLGGEVLDDFFSSSNGELNGQLREEIVGGLLWDLMDDGDNEPHDTVAMGRTALLAALSSHMSDLPIDVGPGGVELADGMHAAVCAEPSLRTGAEALLAERQLPWPADQDDAPCNKTLRSMLPMSVLAEGGDLVIVLDGAADLTIGSFMASGALTETERRQCAGRCRVRRPAGDGWWVKATRGDDLAWASGLTNAGRRALLGTSVVRPHPGGKLGSVRDYRR